MSYLLISNGAGRLPHIETVDTIEDVRARLEAGAEDIVVIDGHVVEFRKETFLFIEDHAGPIPPKEDAHGGRERSIPRWTASPEGAAEHLPDVEGHAGGEADDAPGESPGEGPDESGDGTDSSGGDVNPGEPE